MSTTYCRMLSKDNLSSLSCCYINVRWNWNTYSQNRKHYCFDAFDVILTIGLVFIVNWVCVLDVGVPVVAWCIFEYIFKFMPLCQVYIWIKYVGDIFSPLTIKFVQADLCIKQMYDMIDLYLSLNIYIGNE